MCERDELGVDTGAADRSGAQAASLAQRYAHIGGNFQTEMTILSEASVEMPVLSGALDYSAGVIGQLTALQAHTGALGDAATAGAASARRADCEIGAGLGTIFAI